MIKRTNIFYVALTALGSLTVLISGCNLKSDASQPAANPDLSLTEPVAQIKVLTPASLAGGYYQENDTVSYEVEAKGSQGSEVTCSTEIAQRSLTDGTYSAQDTHQGCSATSYNFQPTSGSATMVYRIKASVTDANSKTADTQTFLLVRNDGAFLSAKFTATLSQQSGQSLQVNLDASTSTIGDTGNIKSYTWQIRKKQDDNSETLVQTVGPENSPQTSVVVESDGIYVIKLTIADESDKAASATQQMAINLNNTHYFDFTMSVSGNAPLNMGVSANTTNIAAGANHFIWDVYSSEDLTVSIYHHETESSSTVLPIISAGTYVIKLKVIDNLGNEHELSRVQVVS
jgi:predicted component of type VI protein secretion system